MWVFGANGYDAKDYHDDAYDGKDSIYNRKTITYADIFLIIYFHISRYFFWVNAT